MTNRPLRGLRVGARNDDGRKTHKAGKTKSILRGLVLPAFFVQNNCNFKAFPPHTIKQIGKED